MVARATVIIPTFGQAEFAVWSIRSVQAQTVRDIEICIICDGSPENMVNFFKVLAKGDSRIRVFSFPKGPRTGEEHRDVVIRRETQGRIICYCAHDDLWLPNHIEEMEQILGNCCFAHTIHANINLPERIKAGRDLFCNIFYVDLGNSYFVGNMLAGSISYFGLTNGAHTRESYLTLKEGWTTTPQVVLLENKPIRFSTDLYMWNKFLLAYRGQCKTHAKLTAIHFPVSWTPRMEWSEAQRCEELGLYFQKIQDPVFLEKIRVIVRDFYDFYQYKREYYPVFLEKIRVIVCALYQYKHVHFKNKPPKFVSAVIKIIFGSLLKNLWK